MHVTIGKNNVEFSDLNTKSPGNCPKLIFFMKGYNIPTANIIIPKIINIFCIYNCLYAP